VIDERDALELAWIEDYLMHDPFAPGHPDQAVEHPWSKVHSYNILGEVMRQGIARAVDQIDWNNIPSTVTPDSPTDDKTRP
jgi:hypothetical protein